VPGTPTSGQLSPPNETDVYRLDVLAGDRYTFDAVSNTGSTAGRWRLVDPFGKVVFNALRAADVVGQSLSLTGTYTLLIEGRITNTVASNYTFNVQLVEHVDPPAPPAADPLALGAVVSGQIAVAGEQDHYGFSLADDALLYLDALTNNTSMRWSLVGPAGTEVSNRAFTASDADNVMDASAVLKLRAGDYRVTVSASGTATGSYSFALADLSAATSLTPGTPVSGQLSPANETHLYRFNAVLGERYTFDAISNTGSVAGRWRLVDPFGTVVFNAARTADQNLVAIPRSETYTLLVEGAIGNTGTSDYVFNVQPEVVTSQSLALDALVADSIATVGAKDKYTFTLSQWSLLYFDALTDDANLRWSLEGPGGMVVDSRVYNDSDADDVTDGNAVLELRPGDYTLSVFGYGNATGAYQFVLRDLANGTSITPGTPVSGQLNPANETDVYRFDAVAGERYTFDVISNAGATAGRWRLVDPFGTVVSSAARTADMNLVEIPRSGVYTLVIEGRVYNTGTSDYVFNVQPEIVTAQPLALDSLVSGKRRDRRGQKPVHIHTVVGVAPVLRRPDERLESPLVARRARRNDRRQPRLQRFRRRRRDRWERRVDAAARGLHLVGLRQPQRNRALPVRAPRPGKRYAHRAGGASERPAQPRQRDRRLPVRRRGGRTVHVRRDFQHRRNGRPLAAGGPVRQRGLQREPHE